MKLYEEATFIVKRLSLKEKCKFCCGIDFWETFESDELNLPSIMLCDGPHGSRKEDSEHLMFKSDKVVKSTCFPTATALASTFDDIKNIYSGDLIISAINKKAYKVVKEDKLKEITLKELLNDLPFRLIVMATRGEISRKSVQGFVDLLNKHYIKGFLQILKNTKPF